MTEKKYRKIYPMVKTEDIKKPKQSLLTTWVKFYRKTRTDIQFMQFRARIYAALFCVTLEKD